MSENIKCPICGSCLIVQANMGEGEDDFYNCAGCLSFWNESKRQSPNAWIACSERLPEEDVNVLIYDRYGEVCIDFLDYIEEEIPFWNSRGYGVTHWQPLPQPPETGKDGE